MKRAHLAVFAAATFFLLLGLNRSAFPTYVVDVRLSQDSADYVVDSSVGGSVEITPANVDPSRIHLSVVDERHRIVLGPQHFHAGPPHIVPADGRRFDERLRLVYNADALPPAPGMYTVEATFDSGAFHFEGITVSEQSNTANFYLSPRFEREPTLAPGQRFLDSAADATQDADVDPPLTDRAGSAVRRAQIGLHPLTLTSVDASISPRALGFAIDGVGIASMRTDADISHLPGLVPLAVDREVTSLEREYAGRPVWTIGGRTLDCLSNVPAVASAGFESNSKVTIVHVFRAAGFETFFARTGAMNSFETSSEFWDANPLVVELAREPQSRLTSASSGLDGGCDRFAARFADRWDFERAFSLQSMTAEHPDWTAATVERVQKQQVRVGMTHAMIAWMFGYPPVYGTKADLDRLDTWLYGQPAPASFCIYFRRNVVARYDPPRPMP